MLERSRLFSYSTGNRQRGKGKRKQTVRGVTHTFLCLANKDQNNIPSTAEKEILYNAGLGKKRIRLNKDDNEQAVIDKIMSSEIDAETKETVGFPDLKEVGGFELLRSSQNCRNLKLIDCRWNANDLQRNCNSQATIYIRPIQRDLSTKSKKIVSEFNSVKAMCEICQVEYPILELREHVDICTGGRINESNEAMRTEDDSSLNNIHTIHTDVSLNEMPEVFQVPPESVPNEEVNSLNNIHILPTDVSINEIPDVFQDPFETLGLYNAVDIVNLVVNFCKDNIITDPVEILKKLQKEMVKGRPLDIEDITESNEGETNYIMVDRSNLLETAFDEVKAIPSSNLRLTLEVQFYNEVMFRILTAW